MPKNDATLMTLLTDAVAAKAQVEQWTAEYDEQREALLTTMVDDSLKTFTADTDYGNCTATVVASEPTVSIDPDKLRAVLVKAGVSTRRINTVLVPTTTYAVDEDALQSLIDDGTIKPSAVPTTQGRARKPFVKITAR